jgi:hypothetical protein
MENARPGNPVHHRGMDYKFCYRSLLAFALGLVFSWYWKLQFAAVPRHTESADCMREHAAGGHLQGISKITPLVVIWCPWAARSRQSRHDPVPHAAVRTGRA